jgi:hypothetical protein
LNISSPSVASHHSPIKIYLKDPQSHPNIGCFREMGQHIPSP